MMQDNAKNPGPNRTETTQDSALPNSHADDITTEFQNPVDSTARVGDVENVDDLGAPALDCLELIEAIRLTAPEYLQDVLGDEATHSGTGDRTALGLDESPIQIGRFRIIRPLGRGGHGIVFLAHDPSLNRTVALKVPRPETLMTESLRRRFLREAEAAAALNHPNIVPVFEAGVADPVCYIAAAYCSGRSLTDWIQQHGDGVSARQAAEITIVLADAVQHAHARGILHRDIKPSNVLLDEAESSDNSESTHDSSGVVTSAPWAKSVKLTDFGLARMGPSASADSLSAELLGTPNYMAPEQASGRVDAVTTATDVYGLGATLYHLLTGRPPLQRENQVRTLLAVQTEDPLPPSARVPGTPRDLDAICLKCLEKDPAKRYQTARQLQEDLQRYLQDLPVQARTVGRLTRVARWCRRRPALTATSALLLLSIVAGAANVVWQWSRAERHLAESQHQAQRARQHLYSAQQAVDELLTEVAQGLKDAPQLQALRRNLLLKAAEMNQQLLDESTTEESVRLESIRAWRRAAEIFAELGDPQQQKRALENGLQMTSESQAELIGRLLVDEIAAERARLLRQRGQLWRGQREYDSALADYEQSTALFDQLAQKSNAPQHQVEAAESTRLAGLSFLERGNYDQADHYLKSAVIRLDGLESTAENSTRFWAHRARAFESLGQHLKNIGNPGEALEQLQLASEDLRRLTAAEPLAIRHQQELAELGVRRAFLLISMKRYAEAGDVLEESLAALRRLAVDFALSPTIKYWLAKAYMGQAVVLFHAERLDESERMHQEAAAILADVAERFEAAEMQRELTTAFGLLAKVRRIRGDWAGAEQAAMTALAKAREVVEAPAAGYQDRQALAQTLLDVACFQLGRQDRLAAADSCRAAITAREGMLEMNPADHLNRTQLATTYAILASAELKLGHLNQAAAHIMALSGLAPDHAGTRGNAAIAWLEMAWYMEEWTRLGIDYESNWTVEECRRRAVDELNAAAELENFKLASFLRLESFGDLLRTPEYHSQLVEVFQQIDPASLAPPMPPLKTLEAVGETSDVERAPP